MKNPSKFFRIAAIITAIFFTAALLSCDIFPPPTGGSILVTNRFKQKIFINIAEGKGKLLYNEESISANSTRTFAVSNDGLYVVSNKGIWFNNSYYMDSYVINVEGGKIYAVDFPE